MFLIRRFSRSLLQPVFVNSSSSYPIQRFSKIVTNIKENKPGTLLNWSENYLYLNKNNSSYTFPIVWLRDNCQCDQCFHVESKSRIIDWKNFDVNVKPIAIDLGNDNVQIKWNDQHSSIFDIKWLCERSFNQNDKEIYTNNVYGLKKTEWNKNGFDKVFKNFKYDDIMNKNSIFKEWLECMIIYGIALVKEVPASPESCRNLANKVEFIKRTHYGEEFTVKAKPGTTNVAYLSSNLQLHTDLPYYEYKPGVNLLHCVTQSESEGGENLLCDGLHVTNKLKNTMHNCYELLKTTEVQWEDIGEENGNKFHSIYRAPVICENANGDVIRINYSTPQRGSHFNVPIEKVKPWYESLKVFVNMIHKESAKYKMSQGEILCFDNRRLLHGRTEYIDTAENIRHVIGVYLDWDYIYSRWRVLNY